MVRRAYIYKYICMYVCMYVCIYIYICIYMYMYMYSASTETFGAAAPPLLGVAPPPAGLNSIRGVHICICICI